MPRAASLNSSIEIGIARDRRWNANQITGLGVLRLGGQSPASRGINVQAEHGQYRRVLQDDRIRVIWFNGTRAVVADTVVKLLVASRCTREPESIIGPSGHRQEAGIKKDQCGCPSGGVRNTGRFGLGVGVARGLCGQRIKNPVTQRHSQCLHGLQRSSVSREPLQEALQHRLCSNAEALCFEWGGWRDLNPRPLEPQSGREVTPCDPM